MPSQKTHVQYRYYKAPPNLPVLALLGSGWVRPYGSDLAAPHFHNLLEIGYCHDGVGNMVYGEDVIPYGPGSISVIPPNYLHNTIAQPGTMSRWEYLFVDAAAFLLDAYAGKTPKAKTLLTRIHGGFLHFKHAQRPAIGDLIRGITDQYREQGELYVECVRGLLAALLIHIAREHPIILQENDPAQPGAPILHEALEYVGDNYHRKIAVAEIAEVCHISETHLRRLFGLTMGISPLAYVNHVRLEAACRLLSTNNAPVREVAARCGFPTLSTFNRNFMEAMGTTPQQWRNNASHRQYMPGKTNVQQYDGWL